MSYALNTASRSAICPTNLLIRAAARPTTDAEQVAQQPRRLAHDVHGRARRVGDRDGYFLDLQPVRLGDDEDLDVEREAIDLRALEDEAGRVGAECLETALRVAVVAEQHCVRQPVDDAPTDLAKPAG